MNDYITYRKVINEELDKSFLMIPRNLQLGFWPPTICTMTNTRMFDAVKKDMTP